MSRKLDATLTVALKALALKMGVAKIGVAGRDNLAGPPEADLDFVLPGARVAISFLVVEPEAKIMDYLSKRDPRPYRDHFHANIQLLGRAGLALAEALRQGGYRAEALSPNGVYRPGSNLVAGLRPPFAHRYAAVAAGLGAIGLSGNLMTPEFGARVYLSSVITDAPLVPDEPLAENPCDNCNICLHACPGGFMAIHDRVSFILGGHTVTHAAKGMQARCGISCGGFTGLSRSLQWSTWAPGRYPIPDDDAHLVRLLLALSDHYFRRRRDNPALPNFVRLSEPLAGYPAHAQGVLARSRPDTETTCGNCAIVCLETKEKRARALKALRTSGVVMETADGVVRVMRPDEALGYEKRHPEVLPLGPRDV